MVGEVTDPTEGVVLVEGGKERTLVHPGVDPFWGAFGRWAEEASAG